MVFENHPKDSRYNGPLTVAPTLAARMGTGGNNQPFVMPNHPSAYCIAGNIIDRQDHNGGNGCGFQPNISYTLTSADRHAVFSRQRSDEFCDNDVVSTQGARQYKDATDLVCHRQIYGQSQFGNYCEGVTTLRAQGGDNGGGSENLVATTNLVRRLTPLECERLQGFPDATDLPEYQDYKQSPTLGNATELIYTIIEYNFDTVGARENYVGYISHRPRVVKEQSHGLFTVAGKEVVVTRVAAEVAGHQGVVWTPIISLRREDADRLGYNRLENWQQLLRASADKLAEAFKIAPDNFRWYAALHDEGHHPHIHMVCYSADTRQGFVTQQGMEQVKSLLARQIFRDDLLSIYQEQTQARDSLATTAEQQMKVLCSTIKSSTCTDDTLAKQIAELYSELQAVKGKRLYGYLTPQLKRRVDGIVDTIAGYPKMAELYNCWWRLRLEVMGSYQNTELIEQPPLSKQQELRRIRNVVIAEVLRMGEVAGAPSYADTAQTPTCDSVPNTVAMNAATRLLHGVANIFEGSELPRLHRQRAEVDRKRRRKLRQKLGRQIDLQEQQIT